jgi:hypothetical protein
MMDDHPITAQDVAVIAILTTTTLVFVGAIIFTVVTALLDLYSRGNF